MSSSKTTLQTMPLRGYTRNEICTWFEKNKADINRALVITDAIDNNITKKAPTFLIIGGKRALNNFAMGWNSCIKHLQKMGRK